MIDAKVGETAKSDFPAVQRILYIYMMKLRRKWIKSFLIDRFNVGALLNATPHAPTTIFTSLDFISDFILGL
jgi:hypothetical protein